VYYKNPPVCKTAPTGLRTSDFDYGLPLELVATHPVEPRDASRLLCLDRVSGQYNHAHFRDLVTLLPPRSLLVVNDTRVLHARLLGRKATGGAVELLLTRMVTRDPAGHEHGHGGAEVWEALGKNLGREPGERMTFAGGLSATVLERRAEGRVLVRLQDSEGDSAGPLAAKLEQVGEVPLPPYIEAARKRAPAPGEGAPPLVDDRRRYQTVYADAAGAVAAPTAGLHFTPELLAGLEAAGHRIARLTLHVGPGTFRPVKAEDPREHVMDEELYAIPAATAAAVNAARAAHQPVVAVGTTVVRTLEAAARDRGGEVRAGSGATRLFLLPGDEFRVVTDLITNFHLPKSTLLMLVAAFAGRETTLRAYRAAVEARYHFYSYGDAMLITGRRAA